MNVNTNIKPLKGTTPSRRFASGSTFAETTKSKPEKQLVSPLRKKPGRDFTGRITIRHKGGGEKQNLRHLDWFRDKKNIKANVAAIEYDPTRSARIALLHYEDGEKNYILAPVGLSIGDSITQGEDAEIKIGNALPLRNIPIGTLVHNIELQCGKGAKIVRSAGTSAVILGKEGNLAQIKMPSGEIRVIPLECQATIGQVGNVDWKNIVLGKAGRTRHLGIRPTVRGTAQNPRSHPHGGGEGRSGEGMKQPKTPWGKPARGKKTRKKRKYSDKYIIQRRNKSG
jgi:large subunit ribosomal protein L2